MVKKRYGFTLGEILLAVLIIGIISVLTIPSIIKDTNQKARMALLKGTIANFTNAVQSELVKQRTNEIMDTDIYQDPEAFLDKFDGAKSGIPFADSYKRYSDLQAATDVIIPNNTGENQAARLMKNGVGVGIVNNSETSTTYVAIDVTGSDKPNLVGADYFVFKIEWEDDDTRGVKAGDIGSFVNGGAEGEETKAGLKTLCEGGNGAACYRLVELSGYDPRYLD